MPTPASPRSPSPTSSRGPMVRASSPGPGRSLPACIDPAWPGTRARHGALQHACHSQPPAPSSEPHNPRPCSAAWQPRRRPRGARAAPPPHLAALHRGVLPPRYRPHRAAVQAAQGFRQAGRGRGAGRDALQPPRDAAPGAARACAEGGVQAQGAERQQRALRRTLGACMPGATARKQPVVPRGASRPALSRSLFPLPNPAPEPRPRPPLAAAGAAQGAAGGAQEAGGGRPQRRCRARWPGQAQCRRRRLCAPRGRHQRHGGQGTAEAGGGRAGGAAGGLAAASHGRLVEHGSAACLQAGLRPPPPPPACPPVVEQHPGGIQGPA
jgi:hypothetical protein